MNRTHFNGLLHSSLFRVSVKDLIREVGRNRWFSIYYLSMKRGVAHFYRLLIFLAFHKLLSNCMNNMRFSAILASENLEATWSFGLVIVIIRKLVYCFIG